MTNREIIIEDLILNLKADKKRQKNESFLNEIFLNFAQAAHDAREYAEGACDDDVLEDVVESEKILKILEDLLASQEPNYKKIVEIMIDKKSWFCFTI